MHFQISEILEATDVDLVVHLLEESLRALAKDVVRTEQELVAFGIGPSPKVKNGNDKAVFHSSAVDAGVCVSVDVNYQASGLLGNTSQNEVVRDKILSAIHEAKTGLRHRSAGPPPPSAKRRVEKAVASPVVVEVPVVVEAPVVVEQPVVVEKPVVEEKVVVAAKAKEVPAKVAEVVAESVAVAPVAVAAKPASAEVRVTPAASNGAVAAKSVPAAQAAKVKPAADLPKLKSALMLREELQLMPMRVPLEGFGEEEKSSGSVLGWVAVLLLCAGSGGGWVAFRAHKAEVPAVAQTASAGSAAAEVDHAPVVEPPEAIAEPGYVVKVEEPDLTTWVQNWADAMGSRDPEAQTAFYADPVDRYFLTPHVGHAALLESKRAALESREASSTLKINDVEITRQTPDSASVRLVKRFVSESPKYGPVKQTVRSQLKVNRIDGAWRITEEHDLK